MVWSRSTGWDLRKEEGFNVINGNNLSCSNRDDVMDK